MALELKPGMKVKIKPGRPFAGREAEILEVGASRITVKLVPDGMEVRMLLYDVEVLEEKKS